MGEEDVSNENVEKFKTSVRCVSDSGNLVYIMKDDFLKL